MPSFDIVSEVDLHEVTNAVDQTCREISQRYDFKGSKSSVELEDGQIKVMTDDEMKLNAIEQILKQKFAKRGVGLKLLNFQEPEKAGGDMLRQLIKIKQGLEQEDLKKLGKMIKETKIKVSTQIQGNQLRVTGKKRDHLQEVIEYLKKNVDHLELQFTNFRD